MPAHAFGKRFALLIGIDSYQEGGARKQRICNEPLRLKNLAGCVNDVQAIKTFIEDKFELDSVLILTSAHISDSESSPERQVLPTFENIRTCFERVASEACAGDFFFFHFSGHGARLQKTEKSPKDGRMEDPSLITADYCAGGPALRGWQLNAWLKRLDDYGVQVYASLDSCYSGGAWRDDRLLRTPKDWIPPPNLPADEAAAQGVAGESICRDGKIDECWGINPGRFTLMAACKSQQSASEKPVCGKVYGEFTYAMLQYLKEIWPRRTTYHTVREQVASRLDSQSPQVYGQDRLVFFENFELSMSSPLVCKLEGNEVFIPAGRFHGIENGAQFTSFCPLPTTFTVDWADAFSCGATLPSDVLPQLKFHNEVNLSRWSLGTGRLKIVIDSRFSTEFLELLRLRLGDSIFGDLDLCREGDIRTKSTDFRLSTGDDDDEVVHVFGPVSVTGYEGPIRGVHIGEKTPGERAIKSALTVTHLVRFHRILQLCNEARQDDMPFDVTLRSLDNPDRTVFHHDEKVCYSFTNRSDYPLYWAIIILSSGFQIKQIYPINDDDQEPTWPEKCTSVNFRSKVPECLHKPLGELQLHRDIVRTVVHKTKLPSLRSLEMGDIWDTEQMILEARIVPDRHAKVRTTIVRGSSLDVWIKDTAILTTGSTQ